jgi:hypothetical protein
MLRVLSVGLGWMVQGTTKQLSAGGCYAVGYLDLAVVDPQPIGPNRQLAALLLVTIGWSVDGAEAVLPGGNTFGARRPDGFEIRMPYHSTDVVYLFLQLSRRSPAGNGGDVSLLTNLKRLRLMIESLWIVGILHF